MSTPEAIYKAGIEPGSGCDIGLHLPMLRSLAHGKMFEIGVRGGSSTSAFILGLRDKGEGGHLWSADVNPLCGTEVFEPMSEWTFIHANSTLDFNKIVNIIPLELDVLFLDGEHNYEQVRDELALYGPLVKKGGVILMHDIELSNEQALHAGLRYLPGVMQAALEYGNRTGCRLDVHSGSYGLGILHK